jgi:hypothetical protein
VSECTRRKDLFQGRVFAHIPLFLLRPPHDPPKQSSVRCAHAARSPACETRLALGPGSFYSDGTGVSGRKPETGGNRLEPLCQHVKAKIGRTPGAEIPRRVAPLSEPCQTSRPASAMTRRSPATIAVRVIPQKSVPPLSSRCRTEHLSEALRRPNPPPRSANAATGIDRSRWS